MSESWRAVTSSTSRSPRATSRSIWLYRSGPGRTSTLPRLGKALLAWKEPAEIEDLVALRGLPALTARTITMLDAWKQELARVRERGWSTDDEEAADGLRCLAAPVRDESCEVVAALSISAPTTRLSQEDVKRIAPTLINTANHVSASLGWRPSDPHGSPSGTPPWLEAPRKTSSQSRTALRSSDEDRPPTGSSRAW